MQRLKEVVVRVVKPRISDSAWQRLRSSANVVRRPRPEEPRPTKPAPSRRDRLRQMSLTELGHEFKTDKAGAHHYTQHYERHFKHLRNQRFALLEIGVGGYSRSRQGGASLKMWKHFFRRAQIIGLDIEDKSFLDRNRITTYQGSQTDETILRQILCDVGEIKIVVDDGSHRPEHIRETFRILFPLLADDGLYAIEDTQTSYWPERGGSDDRHDPATTMALVKDLVDGLNYEEYVEESYQPTYADQNVIAVHAYHNLVIIEKGRNEEGTRRRKILRRRYASDDVTKSEPEAQPSAANPAR